jgi:hypothetical protein
MASLMAPRRISLALGLALLGGLTVALPAEAACALAPPRISLSGFTVTEGPRRFFLGVEGSDTQVSVVLSGGCGSMMSVDYATNAGTATSGQDYTHTTGTVSSLVDGDTSVPIPVPVSITPDGNPDEPVAESLSFTLSDPVAPGQGTPTIFNNPGTILIVDSDGASRVGFEGNPYSQSETFPSARIPVFWAGPNPGSSQVTYTIGPGPTNPATPGEDYTAPASGTVNFSGNRWATIDLGIVNDQLGEAPEDVVINLAGPSVDPSFSSVVFTIEDNEENVPPRTRFHHPKHKKKYRKNDFKIREWHVFYSDNEGGSGVVAVEIALRQNLRKGKCKWLSKGGWKRGACSDRVWHGTKYDDFVDWYVKRMRQLKPSVKSTIKSYTAFARAIDGAGNVEKDFIKKRNENTFEIKRSRRRR